MEAGSEVDRDMYDVVMAMADSLLGDPDATATQTLEVTSAFLSVSIDIFARIFGPEKIVVLLRAAADGYEAMHTKH